jgi:hypothetical protein
VIQILIKNVPSGFGDRREFRHFLHLRRTQDSITIRRLRRRGSNRREISRCVGHVIDCSKSFVVLWWVPLGFITFFRPNSAEIRKVIMLWTRQKSYGHERILGKIQND